MLKPKQIRKFWQFIFYLLIIIALLIFSFPLIWIVLTGFKTRLDTFSIPPVWFFKPTLENFRDVFFGEVARGVPFTRVYMNSIVIAITATLIPLVFASLAAYSFARFNFVGKNQLAIFIIGTRMLPPIAIVIPVFIMFTSMKLIDTRLSMIIAYSGLNLPFAIWMLRGFFLQIPRELEESAMIDGCTRLQALWMVILPLAAPGLVATALFSFVLAWNDFQFALVLATSKAITLPVAAARFRTDEGPLWGQIGAAAGLVLLPLLVLTFLLQKHIVSGLTMGSVKG
jgi:multiple sugar transport system permease protein